MANNLGVSSSSSYINSAQSSAARASERIASGLRINRAGDDAAGLAISNRLVSSITEFSQSMRNAGDGISLAQTASGDLSGMTENLQRLRELSVQAANGILNDKDREAIGAEAKQLGAEIVRIAENSNFNGVPLLSGDSSVSIQVGDSGLEIQTANLQDELVNLGLAELDLSSAAGAQSALSVLDELQAKVSSVATEFGASVNRLESTINNLGISQENAEASRSRIQDADIAREVSVLARSLILQEAGIALQAQANNNRSLVLKLLA